MFASVAWSRFWVCWAFLVSMSAWVRMCGGIGWLWVSAHLMISCTLVYGVSQWLWVVFHFMPGMVLSAAICTVSYGIRIWRVFLCRVIFGLPIGWSGRLRCCRSSSMLMFQSWANWMAWGRFVRGIVQCFLSLSHRACGKLVLSACTSSWLYGVFRMSCVPCRDSFFMCSFGGCGRFRL